MSLNPFNLPGPAFLLFYALWSACVLTAAWMMRRLVEPGGTLDVGEAAKTLARDPYRVAFLRGGRNEVIRVAVVSLIERGLLVASGKTLLAGRPDAVAQVRRPLDKAILTKAASPATSNRLYSDAVVLDEADAVGVPLKDEGLLPDEKINMTRLMLITAVIGVLWSTAGIKIVAAILRGRSNLLFLFLMALAMLLPTYLLLNPFRTVLGQRVYRYLREFFENLRVRRDSFELNHTKSELTYLAAVFGLAMLPATVTTMIRPLDLRSPYEWASGGGLGGSGCGGGCGGGGGGGCGGGGCGGGCGGCG